MELLKSQTLYISLKFLFAASLDETVEHGINQNDSVLEEVGL